MQACGGEPGEGGGRSPGDKDQDYRRNEQGPDDGPLAEAGGECAEPSVPTEECGFPEPMSPGVFPRRPLARVSPDCDHRGLFGGPAPFVWTAATRGNAGATLSVTIEEREEDELTCVAHAHRARCAYERPNGAGEVMG